jgi:DNA-binding PadR family transcriptional regulator
MDVNGDARLDRPAALSVGLLRPCILAHLVGGDSAYGYELHHQLLGIGVECDQGTVYRALNTMEAEGLLHSTWERTTGGRSRRRYELSESGLDMVDAYVAPVEQLRSAAQSFLEMRKGMSAPSAGPPRKQHPEVGSGETAHPSVPGRGGVMASNGPPHFAA